jgi:hypothetical protein
MYFAMDFAWRRPVNTSERNKGATKTTARGSGRARHSKRKRAEPSYELSAGTLGEAVLELLRLAVEHETPHAPIDPHLAPIDRASREAVGRITDSHAVLKKVVRILLDHRDDRRDRINEVRAAQALLEIADFLRKETLQWNADQNERKKKGEPRHALNRSEPFKQKLSDFARDRFAWWEVPLPDEALSNLVKAAIPSSKIDVADMNGGLLRRLTNAVGSTVTRRGSSTLEKICTTLRGREQREGRFKKPEDAALALGDEPVRGSEMLRYVLRLLVATGDHPQRIADAVMKMWDDEHAKIAPSAREASPSSPDMPTDPR